MREQAHCSADEGCGARELPSNKCSSQAWQWTPDRCAYNMWHCCIARSYFVLLSDSHHTTFLPASISHIDLVRIKLCLLARAARPGERQGTAMLHWLAAPPIQAATSAAFCHRAAKESWGRPCQACPFVSAAAAAASQGGSPCPSTDIPYANRQQCSWDCSTGDRPGATRHK